MGTGTVWTGYTSLQSGMWISGSRMLWFAGAADGSSQGVACLDLSTTTPKSCGYTARTGTVTRAVGFGAQIGGTGIPASDGNLYAAASSSGAALLVCVTPAGAACADVTLNPSGWTSSSYYVASTYGDYVFASMQQTTANSWLTYCYDVKLRRQCRDSAGVSAWPVKSSPAAAYSGTPFAPILSTAGAVTGVCTITNGAGTASTCWNLSGALLTAAQNPYTGTGANFTAGGYPAGEALMTGTKVFLSNGNQVICRDFASYSGSGTVPACAGYTNVSNTTNYTVRPATDLASDCMVATGDGGVITFFRASTGGTCTATAPQTVTVTPTSSYCGTGSASFTRWGTLSLPGLVTSAFTNTLVTLTDQNGAAIAGYTGVRLAAGATLSLASVPKTVTSLTATVTVEGVSDPTGVVNGQISVSWVGDPVQLCFRTTVPPVACDAASPLMLSNTAKAVTTSAAGSDSPSGNATGAVQFSVRAAASQCSLAIAKTSGVQTARPGEKVVYSITVTNTGSQAYGSAAFSDDLTDVLKDATYNADQTATAGTAKYAQPVLSWTGALAPAASATIRYSVTLKNPDTGDHALRNTVVSTSPGSNCPTGSTDPRCTSDVPVTVSDVLWRKVDATAAANILSGATWNFTPVDAAGKPTGPAIAVTDCVADTAAACTGADIEPLGGAFRLTNLGPGTYQLVETRAPVGFQLNPSPIPVTIAATSTTVTLRDVANKQMPVPLIPLTGGLGTDTLTFTGGASSPACSASPSCSSCSVAGQPELRATGARLRGALRRTAAYTCFRTYVRLAR
ncbi:SpaA isopeptide-forming pilin-related protein [Leifsonia xyli]|uniref:DUF7927 domain-containing protein n=1 Tax=Leifsonia xyli TaxID=1575 RepID=UPI003D67B6B6